MIRSKSIFKLRMNSAINIEPIATQEVNAIPKTHHHKWWERIVVKFQAKRSARKIMNGLNEVEQIKSGKRKAKSFDNFLNDL